MPETFQTQRTTLSACESIDQRRRNWEPETTRRRLYPLGGEERTIPWKKDGNDPPRLSRFRICVPAGAEGRPGRRSSRELICLGLLKSVVPLILHHRRHRRLLLRAPFPAAQISGVQPHPSHWSPQPPLRRRPGGPPSVLAVAQTHNHIRLKVILPALTSTAPSSALHLLFFLSCGILHPDTPPSACRRDAGRRRLRGWSARAHGRWTILIGGMNITLSWYLKGSTEGKARILSPSPLTGCKIPSRILRRLRAPTPIQYSCLRLRLRSATSAFLAWAFSPTALNSSCPELLIPSPPYHLAPSSCPLQAWWRNTTGSPSQGRRICLPAFCLWCRWEDGGKERSERLWLAIAGCGGRAGHVAVCVGESSPERKRRVSVCASQVASRGARGLVVRREAYGSTQLSMAGQGNDGGQKARAGKDVLYISFPRPRRTGTRGRGDEEGKAVTPLGRIALSARPGRLGAVWRLCGCQRGGAGEGMMDARTRTCHGPSCGCASLGARAAEVWRGEPPARSDSLGGISPRDTAPCVSGVFSPRDVTYVAEGGRGWSREGEGKGKRTSGERSSQEVRGEGRGGNGGAWTCGEDPSRQGRARLRLRSRRRAYCTTSHRCRLATQGVSVEARGIGIGPAASSRGPRPRPRATAPPSRDELLLPLLRYINAHPLPVLALPILPTSL
ncbi:hypothetical protein K438DRAFT_1764969 [Mycena galopus ATCC 62051]|nr:hypothetical protein K438DRAFT_1764969 [Mycena galopus ATCC 62051]